MPKLGDDAAKRVAEAESAGFLFEEGLYRMQLVDVEEKAQSGTQQAPQWVWKYQFPENALQYAGRQMWRFVSLAEKAAPFMRECFEAVGGTPDQDTDTLVGRFCLVHIIKRPNYKDANLIENRVQKVIPVTGEQATAGASNGKPAVPADTGGPLF